MRAKNYSHIIKEMLYIWLPHNLTADEVIFFPDACPGRSPLPSGCTVITKLLRFAIVNLTAACSCSPNRPRR